MLVCLRKQAYGFIIYKIYLIFKHICAAKILSIPNFRIVDFFIFAISTLTPLRNKPAAWTNLIQKNGLLSSPTIILFILFVQRFRRRVPGDVGGVHGALPSAAAPQGARRQRHVEPAATDGRLHRRTGLPKEVTRTF